MDRIRTDSSDRLPAWLLPVVVDNLATDGPVRASAVACAAWARACEGRDDQGSPLAVLDRAAAELSSAAAEQADDPTAFLAQRGLFGDLVDEPRFRSAFLEARASLVDAGALATVATFRSGAE